LKLASWPRQRENTQMNQTWSNMA